MKQKYIKGSRGFTLIEILIVIGIIGLLAAVVLLAINPARQFAQARNSQRSSNTTAILNAVGQYLADHKGNLPSGFPTTATEVRKNGGYDLCADLVPTYLPALPTDPASIHQGAPITDCTLNYETDYEVVVSNANGRVTISAPLAELGTPISATR